jgi:hypothetical protein
VSADSVAAEAQAALLAVRHISSFIVIHRRSGRVKSSSCLPPQSRITAFTYGQTRVTGSRESGVSGDIPAMAGSDDVEPVSRQPGRRGRPASDEIPQSWVFWSVAAGLALGLLIMALAEVWPLPHHGQHMSFADAFDIAWKVALFPPGIVTARIAVDRINLSSREHQHAIEVARSIELDATQRRITELSAKASDQVGSDKPTVRIGGLTDLERLGQNNPDLRQTVVDRICAYLQMPFDLPELSQGGARGRPVASSRGWRIGTGSRWEPGGAPRAEGPADRSTYPYPSHHMARRCQSSPVHLLARNQHRSL